MSPSRYPSSRPRSCSRRVGSNFKLTSLPFSSYSHPLRWSDGSPQPIPRRRSLEAISGRRRRGRGGQASTSRSRRKVEARRCRGRAAICLIYYPAIYFTKYGLFLLHLSGFLYLSSFIFMGLCLARRLVKGRHGEK